MKFGFYIANCLLIRLREEEQEDYFPMAALNNSLRVRLSLYAYFMCT